MAELTVKTPCDGLLPITAGTEMLSESVVGTITSVAPFRGQEKAASEALKAGAGMGFPSPGRATGKAGARAVWMGQGQAFVLGVAVPGAVASHAALTDQSDAWAVMRLEGAAAEAVLALLVPVDLRAAHFKRGHTVRSQLQHMMVSITRVGAQSFDIMVMRSFAATAVHDLGTAMKSVAARA